MIEQKKRSEIEEKYKWDVTKIYKTEDNWYKDLDKFKEEIKLIDNYKGKLFSSSNVLQKYLELTEKLSKLENELHLYAFLLENEDATNVNSQKLTQLITDAVFTLEEKLSFFDEEFFNTDYDKILSILDSNEYLQKYKNYFAKLNRYRNHHLTEEKELIVNKLFKPISGISDIYEMLTNTEIKYGFIIDEKGDRVELTDSNYSLYIKSKDRNIRKRAFNLMYKGMKSFKNTIAVTYKNDIEANTSLAKIYNFDSYLKQSLFEDDIDLKVYDNLINSVNKNLDKLFLYYKLKKDILKLEQMHLYDMYVNMVEEKDKTYSYEEAQKIVIDALSVLGEDYTEKVKNIFSSRSIDVYNNVGKRSGAFSIGTYDTDTYILLNFEGKLNDVSTIAHEMGHSIHTVYSNKFNDRQYSSYTIFVAEIASTVNELLLSDYLLKTSTDDREKLNIINNLLDTYKGTVYRQTMFAEFEKEVYNRKENGKSLTVEDFCSYYYELNKKYFGDDIVVDEEIKYEWERIPHFYTPFYVYKYATSISAATIIAKKILSKDIEFRDKYLEFLKMGSREFPLEELKTLGIDMTKSEVVDGTLDYFKDLTQKFREIYKKVNKL